MKAIADVERTLLRLHPSDRAWILRQLSAQHDAVSAPKSDPLEEPDVTSLGAVLSEEPLWVAACVVGSAEPKWSRVVLAALPRAQRKAVRDLAARIGATPKKRLHAVLQGLVEAAAATRGPE